MEAMQPSGVAISPDAPADGAEVKRRGFAPSTYGLGVGLVTGAVFFVIGFAGGYGPRLHRITGNPAWVLGLEVLAAAVLIAVLLVVLRGTGAARGASPIFGYLSGWAAAIALTIAMAVFLDARSELAHFGLTPEGTPDRLAGTQAELTRKSHNMLAAVNAFLSFVAAFAALFVITALAAVFVRSLVNMAIRILRTVGVLKPETIADF